MKDTELDAKAFPEIVFTPRRLDGQIDEHRNFQAQLQGILVLSGASHNVVIETRGTLSGRELIATGHLSIP